MDLSIMDLEVTKIVLLVLGQTVAIIEILRRIQKAKFEELIKNIEDSVVVRISSVLNDVEKIKIVYELRLTELEKEYLKSSTSLKNALSDCVSIAVCHARMQYEDKMLVSLERGIEKLGEKLDVLATFHIRETTP